MSAAGSPASVSAGALTVKPAIRKAATVAAVMVSDASVLSRTPADEVTTQPTAMAVLNGDSPASVPPATAITDSAVTISQYRPPARSQTIQATAATPRVTLIAMPRGPVSPGCGEASGTVASRTTSTMARTAEIAGGGFAAPPGGAPRVVSQRSVIRLSTPLR